jgi:hypothetical protein
MPLDGLKVWRQAWSLPVPSEYFYPVPALGTYAVPYKPPTKWHTAQQRHCGTVVRWGKRPKTPDLIRNVKRGLAVWADPAIMKLYGSNPVKESLVGSEYLLFSERTFYNAYSEDIELAG